MEKRIYFDQAGTSWPKAPGAVQAMCIFLNEVGGNVGRGRYSRAYQAERLVFETREKLCALFGGTDPRNVIFTANVTQALNMALKGFLRQGDHVLVTAMEHNAVMRPLTQLVQAGRIAFDRIPCGVDGRLLLHEAEALARPNTRAVVMTHASNVCGTLMPVYEMGGFCRRHGLRLIVDCAQTAGVFPIDVRKMGIDALCFTGHKGLLGPQGTGGLLLSEAFAQELEPLLTGGSGSFSDLETPPPVLPDRFEAGTLNLPGICGLSAALDYLMRTGVETIREREAALASRFINGLAPEEGLRIVGTQNMAESVPVISLDFLGKDNAEAAYFLESAYGIETRCGLHCAPNAHKVLGTFPQGTVRFSIGFQNTEEEVALAVRAVRHILKGGAREEHG